MIVRFTADRLESGLDEESDPYFYVFLADADLSHYLTLQRAQPLADTEPGSDDGEEDEDDDDNPPHEEDDDGIYLEVNDQLFSGYDCVSRVEISPNVLRVELSRPLDRSCPITAVEIIFPAGRRPPPAFLDHLRAIFFEREAMLRIVAD